MSHLTSRGYLKIYFGYAAGVGKTFQMLQGAQELNERGVDVCIGFLEAHGREDVLKQAAGLENVSVMRVAHGIGAVNEMDVDAVLRRRPRACVVDELAHSNTPGSPRHKRWQDVQVL